MGRFHWSRPKRWLGEPQVVVSDLREPGPSNPPPNNRRNPQRAPSFSPTYENSRATCHEGWVGSLIRLFSAFDRNGVCLCGGRTSFFLDRSYSSKTWSRRWFYKGRLPDTSSRTSVMFQPCFKEKTRYKKKKKRFEIYNAKDPNWNPNDVWDYRSQHSDLTPPRFFFDTKSQRWPSPTEFHLSRINNINIFRGKFLWCGQMCF